jgi:hypothetical protein
MRARDRSSSSELAVQLDAKPRHLHCQPTVLHHTADSRLPDRVPCVDVLHDCFGHAIPLHPNHSEAGVKLCRPAVEVSESTRRRKK